MFFKNKKPKVNKDSSKLEEDQMTVKPAQFMDRRLPYNYDYVIPTLLRELINKGIISIDEARNIMSSGESYLH